MLRTFEPKNFENLRTAQPEPKFTGSYKKTCILRTRIVLFASALEFYISGLKMLLTPVIDIDYTSLMLKFQRNLLSFAESEHFR